MDDMRTSNKENVFLLDRRSVGPPCKETARQNSRNEAKHCSGIFCRQEMEAPSRHSTLKILHALFFVTIFFLCFHIFPKTEAKSEETVTFKWTTGSWHTCDCETSARHRTVRCFNEKTAQEVPIANCEGNGPTRTKQCHEECDEHGLSRSRSRRSIKFEWQTGPWEACEGISCGDGGVQLRTVNCIFSDTKWPTVHTACSGTTKPIDQKPCFRVCDEHREMYRWQEGDWDECELTNTSPVAKGTADKCGFDLLRVGSQSRKIYCVSVDNSSVVVENYVCGRFSSPPVMLRPCEVPCPVNCVTSHWSGWSKCSKTCGSGTQYRTRSVLTKAKYGGSDCPKLSSSRPCPKQRECDPILVTFFRHILKFENWTECETGRLEVGPVSGSRRKNRKESKRKLAAVDSSLVGGRKRLVACYNNGEILGDRVTVEETCIMTKDCEVTEWSEWSNCAAKCGEAGTQSRTREIDIAPSGAGARDCPVLEEVEECRMSSDRVRKCNEYTWVTGGWDECTTIDNATCGGGTQKRYVYCVVRNVITIFKASTAVANGRDDGLQKWARMQPVDEEFCDKKYKPSVWQECDAPCPVVHEVSEWSDWSECAPEKCHEGPHGSLAPQPLRGNRKVQKHGFKRRVRKILNNFNGSDPHTTEYIPCDEARCFRWHATTVSPCVASSGRCGVGTQQQTVVCRDIWGRDVDSDLCRRKPAAPTIETNLSCNVPCSSDCVVSEWSSWSPCTNDCKRGRRESGEQTRKQRIPAQQTRFREILANPGPGGRGCPARSSMEETRACNQHRCSIYYWEVGKWEQCLVKNSVTPTPPATGIRMSDMFMADDGNSSEPVYFPPVNGEQICGKGYQTRDVKCWKKVSEPVNDKLCGGRRSKPLITRDCTFPCPKDCVVSEWGEWSDCSRECDKVAIPGRGAPGPVYQRRHRVVVQHRTGRGTPCPLKMKETRECEESEKCMVFRWHASKWTECAKIAGVQSMYPPITDGEQMKCLGAMTRTVQCRHYASGGEIVPVKPRLCYKYSDRPAPEPIQRCLIKCKQDRKFKNWISDNACRATLRNTETFEELYGLSSSTDSDESYITMQKTAKPIGKWSSCNITKPENLPHISLLSKKASEPYCGVGYQERALACFIEGTDVIVDNSHCQYTEFQRKSCEIECPVDCKMSSWASWGECGEAGMGGQSAKNAVPFSPPCGENVRLRHRYRVTEPEFRGRGCPALDSLTLEHEAQLCHTVCDSLFWVPKAWRICNVYKNGEFSNCGKGLQTRISHCYLTDRDSGYPNVARIVEDERSCDIEEKPYGTRDCDSPCRGECVYSEWSSWQQCESSNGVRACNGTRTKTRNVIRQVAPETGLQDSHCDNPRRTVKTEPCELNTNCFTYSAMWTEWSSCVLPPGARCGTGVKRRRSNCISSNGLPVHKGKCIQRNVKVPEPEHELCRVICPIDCVLSEWSAWSQCSDVCDGIVERKRTRTVVREPSVLGRACPVAMETAPCPPKPCHVWKLGKWSECKIPGGNCGAGLRTRDVSCIQHDGIVVGNSLCRSEQGDLDRWFGDSELRQDCQITCVGDCHMTPWTDWSNCHLRCINITTPVAGATSGVQTRSRVGLMIGQISESDCPPREIQEKTCPMREARCYIYQWKTTPNFYKGKRPIWCERTFDGKNVSAGCHNRLKPQEELYCTQNCDDIEHAYCGYNGICECDTDYEARTHSSAKLLSCDGSTVNDEAETVQVVKSPVDEVPKGRNVKTDGVKSTTAQTTSQDAKIPEDRNVQINRATDHSTIQSTETTEEIPVKKSGFLESLGLLTETGELKMWVYGAIAGIAVFLIFIIASTYLICTSCRKRRKPETYGLYSSRNIKTSRLKSSRNKRRHNSSGSNVGVGMVIGMGTPRFPPSNSAMSHTSSTSRSGFSYRDHEDVLWKET